MKIIKLKISTYHRKICQRINFAVAVIAVFLLVGCKPSVISVTTTATSVAPTVTSVNLTPTLVPTLAVVDLPQPENVCAKPIDWRGIKPGISTKQDVVSILGEPEDKGSQRIGPNSFSFYSYKVDGVSEIAGFAKNRIFFRADGIVDWMEVAVGDQDRSYHKVSDVAAELGSLLDVIYVNSSYAPYGEPGKFFDITAGPDQLYVWSSCGIVIDALPIEPPDNVLKIKYSDETISGVKASVNANSIVLIKFLFIPTSYQGFKDYYLYKTPYPSYIPGSAWNIYIKKVFSANQ